MRKICDKEPQSLNSWRSLHFQRSDVIVCDDHVLGIFAKRVWKSADITESFTPILLSAPEIEYQSAPLFDTGHVNCVLCWEILIKVFSDWSSDSYMWDVLILFWF